MGRQVGFYAVGSDAEALESRFQEAGLVALPAATFTEQVPDPKPPRGFTSPDPAWSFHYLAPAELIPSGIHYTRMKIARPTWRLASERSAVIEYEPSKLEGGQVRPGRIYFQSKTRTGPHGHLLRLYERLARFIRGWERVSQESFFVGPEAAKQCRSGELKLMYHLDELELSDKPG